MTHRMSPHPFRAQLLPGLLLAAVLWLLPGMKSLQAGLVLYDFSTASGTQSSVAPILLTSGITATDFTRGPGLTAQAATGAMNSSGWTTALPTIESDYFVFSLSPVDHHTMTISSFSFSERRSLTGPRAFEIRSSLDSFASAISGTLQSLPDNDLVRLHSFSLTPAFASLAGPVEFRIYGYLAESSLGTWRIGNHEAAGGFLVDGFTAAAPQSVPEPSLLLSTAVWGGLGAIRRIHRSAVRAPR